LARIFASQAASSRAKRGICCACSESGRLALRGGYNFSDQYLEVVGTTPQTDIYVASRDQGSKETIRNVRFFSSRSC
jgi:hypothetical protein